MQIENIECEVKMCDAVMCMWCCDVYVVWSLGNSKQCGGIIVSDYIVSGCIVSDYIMSDYIVSDYIVSDYILPFRHKKHHQGK